MAIHPVQDLYIKRSKRWACFYVEAVHAALQQGDSEKNRVPSYHYQQVAFDMKNDGAADPLKKIDGLKNRGVMSYIVQVNNKNLWCYAP